MYSEEKEDRLFLPGAEVGYMNVISFNIYS